MASLTLRFLGLNDSAKQLASVLSATASSWSAGKKS